MESTTNTDSSGAQGWKNAKRVAEKLGYVPSSFSIAVRTLMQDQVQNNASIRPVTKYQVARLLKTPTFKAMIYHAACNLRTAYVNEQEYLTIGTLMDYFEPYDIASMIAAFVYYRKAKALLRGEKWDYIRDALRKDSHIGSQVGVAIPSLGIANGLIAGSIIQIGSTALILENEKAFKEYKRHLKSIDKFYDFAKEEELFGCSSLQIGVFTLSKMGFGVDVSESFTVALDDKRDLATITDVKQLRMRLAKLWIDALKVGDDKPLHRILGEYYPMQKDRAVLDEKVKEIMSGKSLWLEVGKEEASPEKAPKLYKKNAANANSDVPEELSEVFSMDEISKMQEEDFDDLVDQMDAEQEGKVPPGSMVLKEKDLKDLEDMVS